MNVVPFPVKTREAGSWRPEELRELVALFAAHARAHKTDVLWDIGTTERGDPQFYLIGPAPHFECLLCCSRLDARYVLEDGAGGLLTEKPSLQQALSEAARLLMPGRSGVVARLLLAATALRVTLEQKLDLVLEESTDWLVRFAPQLAALV